MSSVVGRFLFLFAATPPSATSPIPLLYGIYTVAYKIGVPVSIGTKSESLAQLFATPKNSAYINF